MGSYFWNRKRRHHRRGRHGVDVQAREVSPVEALESRCLLTATLSRLALGGAITILPDVNGKQLLAAERSGNTDLYTTNGTASGTKLFTTIPGRLTPDGWTNSTFSDYALLDGNLYFNSWVSDGTTRHGLWKTDGTSAVLLLEQTVSGDRSPFEFVTLNGYVYFAANDGGTGRELWRSDGTVTGTRLAVDVIPGVISSNPRHFRVFDGQLFFTTGSTSAETVCKTDGTAVGTTPVISGDHHWSPLSGETGTAVVAVTDSKLILKRESVAEGVELLAMETASASPKPIQRFVPVAGSDYLVDGFILVGSTVYFRRVESAGGQYSGDLWKTDGTVAGTAPVSKLRFFQAARGYRPGLSATGFYPGVNSQNVSPRLMFFADAETQWGLWQTDGVTLTQIPIMTPQARPVGQRRFVESEGRMYSLVPGIGVFEVSQNLGVGRVLAGYSVSIDGNPGQLTAMLGGVWFVAGHQLWQVDPQLPDAVPGPVPEVEHPGELGTIRVAERDVFRLKWKSVPGAVAYRINGELSPSGAARVLDIPWDKDRAYTVRIQAVLASGQFSEATDFSFTGFLNSHNLEFSGSTAFTQQIVLRRSLGSGWMYRAEFLDSGSGRLLRTTPFRWSTMGSDRQEVSLFFPAEQIPSSGRLSVRVSPMTVSAPINAATVSFDLRYSEIAVSFSGARATITWPSVAGPLGYDLWINDETHGVSQFIRRPSLMTNSFSETLPDGMYRIWVRSRDIVPSLWSQPEVINVGIVPRLLAPAGTYSAPGAMGSFRWPRVQGAVRLELWVDRIGGPAKVIHETSLPGNSTTFTPTTPLPYGQYRAWIRSQGIGAGNGVWSAPVSFTVLPPAVQPVVVTSPFDRTPTITWSAPFSGISYELWIGRPDGAEVFRAKGVRGTSFTLPTALVNGSYRVSLRGQTADGLLLPWSDAASVPLMIGLTGVVRGALAGNRTLTWGAISGATRYEIWVNLESGSLPPQSRIYHNAEVVRTSLLFPASLPAGGYRLWIRAVRDEAGETFFTEWTPNGSRFSLT